MKINEVVVMYLYTGEIVRPPVPPDVSVVKGILSSYSFLFLGTPGPLLYEKVHLLVLYMFTGAREWACLCTTW